jgi:hypothetical protein
MPPADHQIAIFFITAPERSSVISREGDILDLHNGNNTLLYKTYLEYFSSFEQLNFECFKNILAMITVETINPVYSNAEGDKTKKTLKDRFSDRKKEFDSNQSDRIANRGKNRTDRKLNREIKRTARKKKRNARKLEKINTPQGEKFLFKLIPLKKNGTQAEKTNPDGTKQEIPAKDIVSTPQGDFDKKEVAKASGLPEEQITPLTFKKVSVLAPTGEVKIAVPTALVGQDNNGDSYLNVELQDENEKEKDVVKEEMDSRNPLKKYEKIILWGGIALVVIIGGIIAYKKFKK